jgi:pSer/pThr/pTyr-binding forkhead associated (FHA) protein
MKDGMTKTLKDSNRLVSFDEYTSEYEIKLVSIDGVSAGVEYRMEAPSLTIGRGPGVDVEVADEAMSRQHAVIEFSNGVLHVRDLGSTNGMACNGTPIQAATLEHGDQLAIGEHLFQLLVEHRDAEPETYEIPETV